MPTGRKHIGQQSEKVKDDVSASSGFSPHYLKLNMLYLYVYLRLLVKVYALCVLLSIPTIENPYCYSCEHDLDIEDTLNYRTCKYCDSLIGCKEVYV